MRPAAATTASCSAPATTPRSRATASTRVDGQSGKDRLLAAGSADSEEFTLQAFDGKARIARDTGPSTTDSTAVETLDVNAAGGQDLIDIGDLTGSACCDVDADLGLVDGARDQIHVQGTDGFDNICVRPFLDTVRVEGLDPDDPDRERAGGRGPLTVFGRGGTDFISADRGRRAVALTFDGGAGTDVIDGTDAADTLLGGPDGDVITGAQGQRHRRPGRRRRPLQRGPWRTASIASRAAPASTSSARPAARATTPSRCQGLLARTRVLLRVHRLGRHGRRRAHLA